MGEQSTDELQTTSGYICLCSSGWTEDWPFRHANFSYLCIQPSPLPHAPDCTLLQPKRSTLYLFTNQPVRLTAPTRVQNTPCSDKRSTPTCPYSLKVIVTVFLLLVEPTAPLTFSVMIPVMRSAGVTSKDGFQTLIPAGAMGSPRPPLEWVSSLGSLCSAESKKKRTS